MSTTTATAPVRTPLPTVEGADPSRAVIDSYKIAIALLVSKAFERDLQEVYKAVQWGKKDGDFSVPLGRFGSKSKKQHEDSFKKVKDEFERDDRRHYIDYISSVTEENGMLLFMLNDKNLSRDVLTQIDDLGLTQVDDSEKLPYGANNSGKGRKIVIEYSSPNIAKEFHIGHLRSTIIGAFLANLYRTCGWEVISMNYLGDWGTQFGLIAVGFEKYGSESELEKDAIKALYDVYVKINKDVQTDPQVKTAAAEWFCRMENGDSEALKPWKAWRDLSIKKYEEDYNELNVHFNVYTGESEVSQANMDQALEKLEEKGLIEEKDGAKRINLENWKLGTPVIRKRDGTSIYLSRDIGGAIDRYEKYKFDKMIYVVSSQQDGYLQQLFKILELMDYPWAKDLVHINYGLVEGMSTRKGTVVFLRGIIEDTKQKVLNYMKKDEKKYDLLEDPQQTSREVSKAGIKIQDMVAKRIKGYEFNWERVLAFEGDTGPYLHYAHVRLASMGRNNSHLLPLPTASQIDTDLLSEYPLSRKIILLLARYPEIVLTALREHEPCTVVTYLFDLAHLISSAWEKIIVKGETDLEKARAKMFMYEKARVVLGAGMELLTIKPLDRM